LEVEMADTDIVIQDIKNAQIKLNNLLTSLYQHDLIYELSINNPCGTENDTRRDRYKNI
jgi:hypothetical protein